MPSSPQCILCEHYTQNMKCKAFPKGIPLKISSGEHDHSKKYGGEEKGPAGQPILYKERK